MTRLSNCPDTGDLQHFALGKCSEAEALAFEEHLKECEGCFRTLQALPALDTLIEAMHTPIPGDFSSRQEAIGRFIQRLKELHPATQASANDDTMTTSASSADRAARDPLAGALGATTTDGLKKSAANTSGVNAAESYAFLAPPERPDEIGRLGPYRIQKVLGSGGMGVVFQAEDPHLQRMVALKAMLPTYISGTAAKKRFLREARTAASIKHHHIVTIHQVGEDRGTPYLAMEFLEGESLEARLEREKQMPLKEVLRIGREVTEGLAAAHERGLVHRDIKPANIWLEGERSRVKVLDFGLARTGADTANLTQPGAIVGTPAYMAPEQTRAGVVDFRADLFSLGCVFYRMATGEMANKGTNTLSMLASVALDTPPPPRALNPEIPTVLSDLIMLLLAKKPEDRPPSAAGVVEVLEALEQELPGKARTPRPDAKDQTMVAESVGASMAGAVQGGLAALPAGGAVIYVKTDQGTLKIVADDDDVKVIVEKDGKEVTVIDKKTGTEVPLASGEYTLRLGDGNKDIEVKPDRIVLKRGETVVATISKIGPSDAVNKK